MGRAVCDRCAALYGALQGNAARSVWRFCEGLPRLTLAGLVFRYSVFAVIATAANLGLQRLVLAGGDDAVHYGAAILLGTLVGLLVKYLLDKRWIFHDIGTGLVQHGTKFTRYAIMGVFTTAIFWGSETAFWLIWHSDLMREIGAVIGLAAGYVIKYQLDARFVFTDALNRGPRAKA